ncbi:unnamed protein product, partial [Ectocarpus sp. 6 AP-2014]
ASFLLRVFSVLEGNGDDESSEISCTHFPIGPICSRYFRVTENPWYSLLLSGSPAVGTTSKYSVFQPYHCTHALPCDANVRPKWCLGDRGLFRTASLTTLKTRPRC